jgi:hypothetical protein
MGSFRAVARGLASGVLAAGALAGCTAVPAPPVAAPEPPPPPAPPAACLLDTGAVATGTGLTWVPDLVTATDIRCVYDPSGGGDAFLVVDLAPGADVRTPAALCDEGSSAPLPSGGLVCRFGPGVFGVGAAGDRVVTVAAAEVPPGTDPDRLSGAFGAELERLATS